MSDFTDAVLKAYREQPFNVIYKKEDIDILRTATGKVLRTKDEKYHTHTRNAFSYWYGQGCYADTAYGYFFIHSGPDMIQNAVDNLNKCLTDSYNFNPVDFERKFRKQYNEQHTDTANSVH